MSKDATKATASAGKLGNEIEKAGRKANKSSEGFGSLARTLGVLFSLNAIKNFTLSVFRASSVLEELDSKARVVFGEGFTQVNRQIDNIAERVGRSNTAILQFATDIGAVIQATGLANEPLQQMSTNFAQLSVDLASFHNTSDIQAFNALRSAITGELEPLKRFGVVMTQANLKAYALAQGIDTNIEAMNQAQLTTLRYNFILENTQNAQGDAERTADSLANQVRRLEGNWTELKETLGQDATPAAANALSNLNSIVQIFTVNIGAAIAGLTKLFSLMERAPFGIGAGITAVKQLGTVVSIRAQQAEAQLNLNKSLSDAADIDEIILNKTIEEYNAKFGTSKSVSDIGTTSGVGGTQKSLKEQLDELQGLSPTGGGSGSASKAAKEAERLAKEQLDREKQRYEAQRDYYEQKKKILGLTQEEERAYIRLEGVVNGAFDIRQAETFEDILTAVNSSADDLTDAFEESADAVKTLKEELADAEKDSKKRIEDLKKEKSELLQSFTDEDADAEVRKAEQLAKELLEATKKTGGAFGSKVFAKGTDKGNTEAQATQNAIRNEAQGDSPFAAELRKQIQLLEDLESASNAVERANIQEAFDKQGTDAARAKKVADIDAQISEEERLIEQERLNTQEKIAMLNEIQGRIRSAFEERQRLSAQVAAAEISDLNDIRQAALATVAVLGRVSASSLAGVNNVTNQTSNVIVNNYGENAKANTDLSRVQWKSNHVK